MGFLRFFRYFCNLTYYFYTFIRKYKSKRKKWALFQTSMTSLGRLNRWFKKICFFTKNFNFEKTFRNFFLKKLLVFCNIKKDHFPKIHENSLIFAGMKNKNVKKLFFELYSEFLRLCEKKNRIKVINLLIIYNFCTWHFYWKSFCFEIITKNHFAPLLNPLETTPHLQNLPIFVFYIP